MTACDANCLGEKDKLNLLRKCMVGATKCYQHEVVHWMVSRALLACLGSDGIKRDFNLSLFFTKIKTFGDIDSV